MKRRISLTMIVKNESFHLVSCLESVKNDVDEIVIVDTGSTDDTVNIAQRYTSKVYSFPWHNDFSAARNFAIEQASGDWILALDADEEVEYQDQNNLHTLLQREQDKEAFLLPLLNPVSDSTEEYNTFYVLRLFRNNESYRYVGKIHEQVSLPNQQNVGLATSPILKHKSLPLKVRHQKRNRNLALLKKAAYEDPDNLFLHYYLGVEWLMLGKAGYALPFLKKAYNNLSDAHLLFRTPALKYLLLSLKELGQLDEALSLCLETSLQYPDFTDLFYLGGLLLEEKEEYYIALKWFDKAITCGTPPALLSHSTGTESFLAYYHLGFCYDRIGKIPEARNAYETALKLNPKYHFPLYSLFLNLLNEKGPTFCYQHLDALGLLEIPLNCLTSAELFFRSNHADKAFCCLETYKNIFLDDEDFPFFYGKYCIYSGRLQTGFNSLLQITKNSPYYNSAQTLLIVSLILLGNLSKAKTLAIKLWKHPATRGEAHIFLWLIRFMQNQTLPPSPLKIREKELLPWVTELFLDYKRYQSPKFFSKSLIAAYGLGLEALIKATEKGFQWLLNDYDQRLQDVKLKFTAKYGDRRLLVES
ncbi:glycosyltransferase [Desulfosporosinus youngiae]|uniref:Glycosyl transferase n=1 Tax=Desulfosporosinus youngiae DSM 17734 TaxID=768710 RepID=H5XS00_9FIRM|nr:TPR domain-containing glycosyltransferase [Desulfosporosinus youngiae]EHQ87537.1 glycosyl transferase [Desulfosporosinus youngiae DSM 17734]